MKRNETEAAAEDVGTFGYREAKERVKNVGMCHFHINTLIYTSYILFNMSFQPEIL